MMIEVRIMSPSTPAREPMMMTSLVLLLDSEAAGLSGIHNAGEGPVQRPVGVYLKLRFGLLNKLSGTYPVKLLPSTNLHVDSEHLRRFWFI